ncbi:uncharacterized protein B0P05DRAFT_543153 [Gilbertella persicaria]|uniref:uncharacterized protein n=1 Tax=Gilbertella persicaria TaxID=101096 RepID=UPI00221F54F7|nr:uncharacterized protein B0P05DRAFT_543153 [Gilbertella persicaria]KAI8078271.1 hypothetical protein B0P05DRAFT_543153 [Gilbertella persicaria]
MTKHNLSKSYSCLISEKQAHSIPSSVSTTSLHQHKKRFHTAHLGKPPGLPTPKSTHVQKPVQPPPTKIAPMKEVEKMIADLKKENFDLKLRLYHLENLIAQNTDIYELKHQNHKIRANLEHKNKRIDELEQELQTLLEKINLNDPPTVVSIGTQTETVLESSPEAFGLLPNKKISWQQQVVANEDNLKSVLHALQQVKIDKNQIHHDSWSNQNNKQGKLRRPLL